ncbi:transposase [Sphingobium sp. BHU LFT2]|nr:transposase [Sphingobium sp. BHU LFT2]
MLDQNKAVIGDPVSQILRQWLQAWPPCFTAPSWVHVLVLVMGGLLATGKRTVTSCLRVTGRADAANLAIYHRILNRARWSSRAVARRLFSILVERLVPDGPVITDVPIAAQWCRPCQPQYCRSDGYWFAPLRESASRKPSSVPTSHSIPPT